MHDDDLVRTTNVAAVFPARANDRAETFTLAELKQLNAGEWFVQVDPFGTIAAGLVTSSQQEQYRREPVPTLAEIVELLKQNEMVFIFDLDQPPDGHPFHDTYFDIVLDMLRQAGIDSRIWYLVNDQELAKLKAAAPEMEAAYGGEWRQMPVPADLAARGYRVINSDFSFPPEWLAPAHQAGLLVNQWTVDEPWQFTRQWLLGADAMTTNNVQGMLALQRPNQAIPYATYLPIWTVIGLAGLGLALIRRG
jgi:glycerophosphoryl diester phosphodiesterase